MTQGFDHEWTLDELLDPVLARRLGEALSGLLDQPAAISAADGGIRWGTPAVDALRLPLVLELEALGFLHLSPVDRDKSAAARELVMLLLRAQMRYRMASSLHLEAVAEDFESLKREHARVVDSENRYRKLAQELDSRVKAQVAQLEERQQMLYAAEKLAAVGQLAAGMAHEINNPLGFVRSNLSSFQHYLEQFSQLRAQAPQIAPLWQALDLDFILEDGRELLLESTRGLDRISHIVADLKSFSNVDRAQEEFIDLNDCLRHAIAMMSTQLPPGVDIVPELLPLPGIVGLPGLLNQLFFNVLKNAAQAIADSGHGGEIRVSSEATEDGTTIRIHDCGVGMDALQREHAFEPFYTTRPVGGGIGLGLSTARNIVLEHSGRIDLDSTPGVGTTVTLFFPARSSTRMPPSR